MTAPILPPVSTPSLSHPIASLPSKTYYFLQTEEPHLSCYKYNLTSTVMKELYTFIFSEKKIMKIFIYSTQKK